MVDVKVGHTYLVIKDDDYNLEGQAAKRGMLLTIVRKHMLMADRWVGVTKFKDTEYYYTYADALIVPGRLAEALYGLTPDERKVE